MYLAVSGVDLVGSPPVEYLVLQPVRQVVGRRRSESYGEAQLLFRHGWEAFCNCVCVCWLCLQHVEFALPCRLRERVRDGAIDCLLTVCTNDYLPYLYFIVSALCFVTHWRLDLSRSCGRVAHTQVYGTKQQE